MGAQTFKRNHLKTGTDVSTAWSKEWMDSLPEPKSKISNIKKLVWFEYIGKSNTTTKPASINAVMNEMTKQEALDYDQAIKDSGATVLSQSIDKEKILLMGQLDDGTEFVFSYLFEDHFGYSSMTNRLVMG